MAKKNYTVEQIIIKLREIEVLCGQGKTIAEAVRQSEITEQTYYRWRKEYGGRSLDYISFDHPVADANFSNYIVWLAGIFF